MPNDVKANDDRPKVPVTAEEAYQCKHMRCRTLVISAEMQVPVKTNDGMGLIMVARDKPLMETRHFLQGPPTNTLVCVSPAVIENAIKGLSGDIKEQVKWTTTRLDFCQVCTRWEKRQDDGNVR